MSAYFNRWVIKGDPRQPTLNKIKPSRGVYYLHRLLNGEAAAISVGGCAVRLVGLYHSQRGAHTFFLRAGEVARWGGYVINLIHYEDAAALCLAVNPNLCPDHVIIVVSFLTIYS